MSAPAAAPAEKEQIKWHRVPVDRKVMSELMKKSDLKGLWQFGGHLALVTATGILAFHSWYHWNPAVTAVLIYVHGMFYSFLGPGAAVHELSHKTVFRTAWLNDWALRFVSFLTFWNHNHYRSSHVKHHQLTVYKGLDLEVELPLTTTAWTWFNVWGFNFELLKMTLLPNLRWAFGITKGEWERRIFPESNVKLRRDLFNWARFLVVGHLALLAVFVYFGLWPLIFLVTLATFIGNGLNFLVGFPQHAGLQPSVPDFRLCCRTYILHPFPSFLYWRMNYHIEHHMYPSVPCYNLHKLREAMIGSLPQAHVGLVPTWKEILSILRKQRQDPDYCYVPELPGNAATEDADDTELLREARAEV